MGVSSKQGTNRLDSRSTGLPLTRRKLQPLLSVAAGVEPECTCQTKEGHSPLDLLKRNPNLGLAARRDDRPSRMCDGDEQRHPREHLIRCVYSGYARLFRIAQLQPSPFWPFGSQDWVRPGQVLRVCKAATAMCDRSTGSAIAANASLWSRPHVDAASVSRASRSLLDQPS